MKNIMKSIWYEILRSKLMIRIYIIFILFIVLTTVLNVGDSVQEGHTSGMLAGNPNITYEIQLFVLGFVVALICGEDYKDKVANYEVMSGHSRISIFFARSLMGIIAGTIMAEILSFVPIITGILIDGWGSELVLSDILIRHLLFIFPYLRLAAFFALLTYLVKNPYVIMAAAFLIATLSVLIIGMVEHSKSFFVSLFNFVLLTNYDGWSIYNLDPEKGIVKFFSYNSSVSSEMIIGTIVVSLIMTGIYLFMGYALFRRDELN